MTVSELIQLLKSAYRNRRIIRVTIEFEPTVMYDGEKFVYEKTIIPRSVPTFEL